MAGRKKIQFLGKLRQGLSWDNAHLISFTSDRCVNVSSTPNNDVNLMCEREVLCLKLFFSLLIHINSDFSFVYIDLFVNFVS